jgi:hypothetical protein
MNARLHLQYHLSWITLFFTTTLSVQAATLTLQIRSASGVPVEDAVVYLMSPLTPKMPVREPNSRIDQVNKMFVPAVSVVQTGTRITFPNKDNIRHQVVMGCNIHDNMIAHMLVVDTPYFGLSDKRGVAQIVDVPPGDYSLIAWYYMRPDMDAGVKPLSLKTDQTQALIIKIHPTD